jgi:starch-binding outer membrane protein, SusD/RagB family
MTFSFETSRRTLGLLLTGASLAIAGCDIDKTLAVKDPDVANPSSLNDITVLPTLRASTISDLEVAMGAGGEDGVVTEGGLLADELIWAETFPTRGEMDQRNTNPINGTLSTIYNSLQRARATADRTTAAYYKLAPTQLGRSETQAIAGFTYILLAEMYCNGVPVSDFDVNAGTFKLGTPQTGVQLFTTALAKLDSARVGLDSTLAGNASVVNLIRMGRGRVLLNLNRPVDAAAAVALVPTTYKYTLFHSENTTRQNNGIFIPTLGFARFSVAANEGANGLRFRLDSTDARVYAPRGRGIAFSPAIGVDNLTPMFTQTKYGTRSSNFSFTDGVEARLIEAENLARSGGAYIGILNTLRSQLPTLLTNTPGPSTTLLNPPVVTTTSLPALTAATTQADQVSQVFQERSYWLFLTGHRLGDMRRLIKHLNRTAESVFPSGAYFKGGTYGVDVNFPVPFQETNNPNFTQCLDRNP